MTEKRGGNNLTSYLATDTYNAHLEPPKFGELNKD